MTDEFGCTVGAEGVGVTANAYSSMIGFLHQLKKSIDPVQSVQPLYKELVGNSLTAT